MLETKNGPRRAVFRWVLVGLILEQAVQFGVHPGDDVAQLFGIVLKVNVVHVDHQDLSLGVSRNPRLVALVESIEVVQTNGLLVFTATLLDFLDQVTYAAAEVDEQVRRGHEILHELKQLEEVFVVTRSHEPHGLQIRCEDVSVLIDGAVLYHVMSTGFQGVQLSEARRQEVDLKVE